MSEKRLIQKFNLVMRPEWVSYQIESPSTARGFPDRYFAVEGRHGLIEFKYLPRWPSRPHTIVKIEHYTAQQKAFINICGSKAGGGVFLVIQIGADVLIFDWEGAQRVGRMKRYQMDRVCIFRFNTSRFSRPVLREGLRMEILKVLKNG